MSSWSEIEKKIHDVWSSQRETPLHVLKQNLYDIVRGERDAACSIGELQSGEVSCLCATPAVEGDLSCGTLDVILGLVSEEDTDVTLYIAAKPVHNASRAVKAMQLVPIYENEKGEAYPIINLKYHEIRLKTPQRPGPNLYAVGVRINKELHGCLANLRIPGVGVFRGDFFVHDNDEESTTNVVDELNKVGLDVSLKEGNVVDLNVLPP